jgi:hypothetical protein
MHFQEPMKKSPSQDLVKKQSEENLALKRRDILNLPPEKALTAIADHPYPVTLVQSFAEEDFYLLVHTIGPDDALPVLAVASNSQWEYLLDMENWSRDRLDPAAMTRWYDRLLKADSDRFTHWISQERTEEFEYYLYRNAEIALREHDQDPSELGDEFFSEDQVHYIRLRKLPEEAVQSQDVRDQMLPDLLKRIAAYDFERYQELLLHAGTVLPAEAEEEFFRLRNLRLAEKGILPHHEAVGIYQPLNVTELITRRRKPADSGGRRIDSLPLPRDPNQVPQDANLFVRTLARIDDDSILQGLQSEFAGLCNQVIAADQIKVRERELLRKVVTKTGDYISIGLEKIATETSRQDPYGADNLIRHYLLGDLFRVGYGCALALKWRTDQWRRTSWFADAGLPLGFWGETGLGVLGGLLLKKPLFFDNYASGRLYREFATLADIRTCEQHLDAIIAYDDLLGRLGIKITQVRYTGFLTFKNLLLTLWANHYLAIEHPGTFPAPLAMDQFHIFFNQLWQSDTMPRHVSEEMWAHFLGWLSMRSGFGESTLRERLGSPLVCLFQEIESELGAIEMHDLDPRFIQLFLFAAPE